MRKYPAWKTALVIVALLLAALYALPSAYPNLPSLEIRARSGTTIDDLSGKVQEALDSASLQTTRLVEQEGLVIASFSSTQDQLEAKARVEEEIGTDGIVALGLRFDVPEWIAGLGAKPIALGLDLRGGVHFLLQVDVDFAMERFLSVAEDTIRRALREDNIRHTLSIAGETLRIAPDNPDELGEILDIIAQNEPRLDLAPQEDGTLVAEISPFARIQVTDLAVGQNAETLRRRVDEIGVSEPVIARQGESRIVVQLPGLQDTARAKGILGRRAALELRGVDERASSSPSVLSRAGRGNVPAGLELLPYSDGAGDILVEERAVLTGENIVDASYGTDEAGRPAVHLTLDPLGAAKIKSYTRERVGEQLAIVLIDEDETQVISAPRIDSELHARFLIHGGGMDADEANELALLLRSGSLATPIAIIEERTVGPSLGADNIRYGLGAVTGGFVLVAILIMFYYGIFGMISVFALVANLLCLTALLASLNAGLTLPGLAGFALTLGMAIDANVLINERIREELATGQSPGLAIEAGYARAFATILDANVTTMIAGLALFALGSGPVRGFAVVLCLGLVTSMFTAVVVSRSVVALVYGMRKGRLKEISIG